MEYRVINISAPEVHGTGPGVGPPGTRERAAEELLNGLAAEGYELVGVSDGLAVLRLRGEGMRAVA